MSAIFGFTFHIGRMTEVLTPDIYRELTDMCMPVFHRIIYMKILFLDSLLRNLAGYTYTRTYA